MKLSNAHNAYIKLNYACNSNCIFCGPTNAFGKLGFSTSQAKEKIALAFNDGNTRLVFTGGEPTIREDFLQLVEFAKETGFQEIEVETNGRMLSSLPFCRNLVSKGVTDFYVSIHGATPKVHDAIVRTFGAFVQVFKGLQNINACKANVVTNTVICKPNCEILPEIAVLLAKLEVPRAQFSFVRCMGDSLNDFENIVPNACFAAQKARKAAIEGRKNGVDLTIRSMPLCLFKTKDGANPEGFAVQSIFHKHEKSPYDFDKRTFLPSNIKSDKCRVCKFAQSCEGPWEEYVVRRGSEEFEPFL